VVRHRLDSELVRRGLAPSREHARELIERGVVLVGGAVADKPARLVAKTDALVVAADPPRFVSRGGDKLDAALVRFGIDVAGRRCLDAGSSTGGFTDCLLHRGAASVVAVDVGRGQLHPRLRADRRVRVLERTNIRDLELGDVGGVPFSMVTADLSFISLATVAPRLCGELAAEGADLVVLVKPQFEAGRVAVSRGRGVIRDPALRREALGSVADALIGCGATIMGAMASPVVGPAGNVEFLVHATAHSAPEAGVPARVRARVDDMLDRALAESPDRGRPDAPRTGAAS
jgi:23S rRNA (cytidine1920-2'-O)/16S rRNA (cytidine1409-2'-O)-methyltransferase